MEIVLIFLVAPVVFLTALIMILKAKSTIHVEIKNILGSFKITKEK